MEGYKIHFGGKVVTVWSAPNYCYRAGNVASVMQLNETLDPAFKVFEAARQVGQRPFVMKITDVTSLIARRSSVGCKACSVGLFSLKSGSLCLAVFSIC
jgi:hypothetical protein